MFRFSVGDYCARYSPLTLYTPEPTLLYEPYIFSRERRIAMDEVFVGNNDRVLQGANFALDAEVAPLFSEFHYGLSAARLRSNESNIRNGSLVVNKWEVSEGLTKYFVGNNLDLLFLRGVGLGASWLAIFDHQGTYRGSDTTADTLAQLTNVVSVRPSVDIGRFLQGTALNLKLGAEAAVSLDDSTWFKDSVGVVNNVKQAAFFDTTIRGMAVRIAADAGYAPSNSWSVGLNAAYLMNDDKFRNELAQSPAFVPGRTMNLENDFPDSLQHYTTFDALYNTVFKFTPIAASNRWAKAPFMKNSWQRTVFNQRELDALRSSALDPSLQLVLPFGDATPNRQGMTARVNGMALNGGVELTALVSQLAEKELRRVPGGTGTVDVPATAFSETGGGIKVDLSKMVSAFQYPVELSGSLVRSSATNDGVADTAAHSPEWDITSDFITAGLYYKFWKRAALLGGMQLVSSSATVDTSSNDQKQMHWAAGLEWSVAQGIDAVATYGQIRVTNGKNRSLLKPRWAVPIAKDFTQDLVDVFLRVRF
jgi:hypothetical protein